MAGQPGGAGLHPGHGQRDAGGGERLPGEHWQRGGQGEAAQAAAAGVLRRRPRADPRRILPPAGRRAGQRQHPRVAVAGDHLRHRHPRVGACVYHGGGRAVPPRQHPVQGQMPGDPAARGAVPPPAKMVPEAPHPHRAGVFVPRGAGAEPGDGVEDHEGAVQPGAGGVEEGFPAQPAASVCAHLL